MEIQYYGANCVKINTKKATLVVDDNIKSLGGNTVAKAGDIVAYTNQTGSVKDAKFIALRPGDYEIADISLKGVAARAHMDEESGNSATMYRVTADDIRVAIVGHIFPKLSEAQLEALGVIDVLIIPVGGHGYTLDPVGALTLIKEIDPKIVIPTHYADEKLQYEVPALSLEDALKELGMEAKETTGKLKIKASDLLNDQPQLVVLDRQ